MALNGFALGGAAQGIDAARNLNIQQQQVDQSGLYQRGLLGLEQQRLQHEQQRNLFARADKDLASLGAAIQETLQAGKLNGKDNQSLSTAVQPLVQQYKRLAASAGRDPSAIDAQVASVLANATVDIGGGTPDKVSQNYGPVIASAAAENGIPTDILHKTIKQESGGNPNAVNPKSGATGVAQFRPETAKERGVNPSDPNSAIPGAAKYIADPRTQFGGNLGVALAAYNWGPGNVQKWLQSGADPSQIPAETRNYVQSITGKPVEQWLSGNGQSEVDKWTRTLATLPSFAPQGMKDAVKMRLQTAIQQNTPEANVHFAKTEDGNEVPIIVRKQGANVQITDINGNPYVAPSGDGNTDRSAIADAIMSGKQPPALTGLYRKSAGVRAELSKRGFDLSNAQLEWKAAEKQISSLNGPQMVRYQGLATSVVNTIDEVKSLATEMANSGVTGLNAVKIQTLINTAGNTPAGKLATRYQAAVNTLKEEFANLANGGYAPTEPAWALANQQINGNYGVDQLAAGLEEVQRLIRYRLNAIPNFKTLGAGAANRYVNGGQAPDSGHAQGGNAPAAPPSSSGPVDWQTYFGSAK